jgi:hypothetical protein
MCYNRHQISDDVTEYFAMYGIKEDSRGEDAPTGGSFSEA